MKRLIFKKEKASGAVGYTIIFAITLIFAIITVFMAQSAKLMTHQRDIDDALTDSCLAALVADDVYYFLTYESTGNPIVRLRSNDYSYKSYRECMSDAIDSNRDFYHNIEYDEFIEYEVSGSNVTITSYTGNEGTKLVKTKDIDEVFTPTGEKVTKTSAYAKVSFDIKSIIDNSYIRKSRDSYCTLKING